MSSYSAIDALLAAHTPLPLPVERSRVRRSLGISVEEVAQVVGVSPEVLHAWEEGLAVPEGHPRDAYAYFLHRAHSVVDYCARAVGKRDPAPAPAAAAAPRRTRPLREIPVPRRGRAQHAGTAGDPIREAVVAETAAHAGDPHGAIEALTARAVPDAVRLFETLRVGGRYDIVRRPALPEILRTPAPTAPGGFLGGPRLDWQRSATGEQDDLVAALGINASCLSAFKTHLPLGQLQAADPRSHDRHRAGIHLVTPPLWEHGGYLPHPLGPLPASTEPVWITEPTLRLLLRLSGPRYWLCAPPVVHESWTAPSTEGLLEKFRIALRDARSRALGEDDTVTLAYVKALYTGFVRALGEPVSERALHRPDWMHLIHAQAFANVWSKAYKAHTEGLVVMKVNGSDELHLQGDWRQVFEEGRDLSQLRLRGTYKITADDCGSTSAPGAQCSDPYAEKRRYEYAGGRYVGCRSCGGDLCTSCRMIHLAPAGVPVQDNDYNVCGACR
ncbi:helix-turn-helix domain-containing protein [Streptomyces sp. NPDC051362]|uniref:helix-turn-helix domain-containing protein n=1 Tax=Streptomyces sp. NPDC051362 TaxID=3365651 RepID=UPI00379BA093